MQETRILVYGVTGSGKSTLAKQIAKATGLPYFPIDEITWEPGWIEVPADEQRRRVEVICKQDHWIIDSAYGKWIDVPLSRAELVVALDYPRTVSFLRLLKRTISTAIRKTPICNGNYESIRTMLSRKSILLWHYKSFPTKKERIKKMRQNVRGPKVLIMKSQRQTDDWLLNLTRRKLPI